MVAPETAGDPMIAQKWGRRSLRALREELGRAGHDASAPTVSRLWKKHDYLLMRQCQRKSVKFTAPGARYRVPESIETQKQSFAASGDPYISVDTKKKELMGNCKNAGQAWCQEAKPSTCMIFCPTPLAVCRLMASSI